MSNIQFLQNDAILAVKHNKNDNSVNFANWLIKLNEENNYNSEELAKRFLK